MKNIRFSVVFALLLLVSACSTYESNSVTNPNSNAINPNCPAPANFEIVSATANQVTLHITASGTENQWQIQYGPHGFTPGQGTSILTHNTTVDVMGLNPNQSYDFYVRAKCESDGFSAWFGPVTTSTIINPNAPEFRMKVDGQDWSAITYQANFSGSLITIVGNGPSGDRVAMSVTANSPGQYPGSSCLMAYNVNPVSSDDFVNLMPIAPYTSSGSMTILSINTVNHTISGTFAFDGYQEIGQTGNLATKQIREGVFTNIPYVDNGTGDNSFYADVNGSEFVDVNILAVLASAGSSDTVNINALDSVNNKIVISFDANLTVGTYAFNNTPTGPIVNMTYDLGSQTINTTQGTLTITAIDSSSATGTFSFSATDANTQQVYSVTNGAFTVHF